MGRPEGSGRAPEDQPRDPLQLDEEGGKGGTLGYVDAVITLDSFEELGEACQKYHVAVSTFKDGRRKGTHFECSDFIAFDFDDGTTSQKIHEDCVRKNWCHIIMASKNHLRDKNDGKGIVERFHLFLMHRSNTKEEYQYAAKKVPEIMGWTIDKHCTDATRYFYRHPKALFVWGGGDPIKRDWMERLQNLEREMKGRRSVTRVGKAPLQIHASATEISGDAMERFKRTEAYRRLTSNLREDGNRYHESSSIIGAMIKCGLSEGDCLSLFDQYSTYGTSFTRSSVSRRFRQWARPNAIHSPDLRL
jgi:hypothetical protein